MNKINLWAWVPAGILIFFLGTRFVMLHFMQDVSVDRTVEDSYIASASYAANQKPDDTSRPILLCSTAMAP